MTGRQVLFDLFVYFSFGCFVVRCMAELISDSRGGRAATSLERGGDRRMKMARTVEEYRVLFRMREQRAGGFTGVNPMKVYESLKSVGEGFVARVLPNGVILVECKNKEQAEKAKAIGKIAGKKVETTIPVRNNEIKGVIYGVSAELSEKDIKEHIKGGCVNEVKRFKAREGGSRDAPVLISFEGSELPERVYIFCMSYQVKAYQRPPLRCFKCQRFGHMAASCRGNRRCAKCGGDHDVLKCEVEDKKCCNCGGAHMASSRECTHFVKAKKVQEVQNHSKISYAEALKKVEGAKTPVIAETLPKGYAAAVRDSNEISFSKESFLAFIVAVVHGAWDKKTSSDVIKFVAGAADRFLGVRGYSPEELHAFMHASQESLPAGQGSMSQIEKGDGERGASLNGETSEEEHELDF